MIRAQIETEMKKLCLIIGASALFAACGTTAPTVTPTPTVNVIRTYEYQESSARNLEPEQTMVVTPVAADLVVSETKVYHVEREAFKDVRVDASVIKDIAEFKKIALSRAARAHNADVMVGTIMDIVTEDGRLVITVSGYPARYTNFRVATTEDTDLAREAQMFKNDLGNDVVSTPVK